MTPFFLSGVAGDLFCVYFPPEGTQAPRQAVLYFPPFAEEMNKARRMACLQARKLADLGYGVLLVDLFGTGDSEGDFAEARWEIWCDDLARAADWLSGQGAERFVLWGLRLGVMLAMELENAGRWPVERLILWQPVVRGEMFMTRFLRLRVAADMAGNQERLTTKQLRETLKGHRPLEIAGYTLAAELVDAVDRLDLQKTNGAKLAPIDWIEIAPESGRPLSAVSQRALESWRIDGAEATAHVVTGQPFWSTPEVTIIPAVLDKTLELLTKRATA